MTHAPDHDAPIAPHYHQDPKTGTRTWVGPTNARAKTAEDKLRVAREALLAISERLATDDHARDLALDGLKRSA